MECSRRSQIRHGLGWPPRVGQTYPRGQTATHSLICPRFWYSSRGIKRIHVPLVPLCANDIRRGFQLAVIGTYRALQNPDLFGPLDITPANMQIHSRSLPSSRLCGCGWLGPLSTFAFPLIPDPSLSMD